jgi:hypothetical protein
MPTRRRRPWWPTGWPSTGRAALVCVLLAAAGCRWDLDRVSADDDDGGSGGGGGGGDGSLPGGGDGPSSIADAPAEDAPPWQDGGSGVGAWCGSAYCAGLPCCFSYWGAYRCYSFCTMGTPYWCDGPEDCPGNDLCCFNGTSANCLTTCDSPSVVVCHTTADCSQGQCTFESDSPYGHCL